MAEAREAADEIERFCAEVERLRAAILDIDAHATPLGEDDDGFVAGGYVVSVGALHRALGLVGHGAGHHEAADAFRRDCGLREENQ